MLLIEVPTLTDVNFLHLIRSGWSSLLLEWLPSRRCWWVSTILWEEEGMLWWSVKLGFQQIGWEVVGLKLQPCIVGIYSMSLGDSTAHSWTYVESWDLHYGRFLLRESDMVIWNIFTNTMHCTLSSSNHGRDNTILCVWAVMQYINTWEQAKGSDNFKLPRHLSVLIYLVI